MIVRRCRYPEMFGVHSHEAQIDDAGKSGLLDRVRALRGSTEVKAEEIINKVTAKAR